MTDTIQLAVKVTVMSALGALIWYQPVRLIALCFVSICYMILSEVVKE